MKLLVFEPDHSGHRFHYISVMLPALIEAGDVTIAISQTGAASAEYSVHLSRFQGRVAVDSSMQPLKKGAIRGACSKIGALYRAIRRNKPDRVYVPYVDGVAQLLGISRGVCRHVIPTNVSVEALMMASAFPYPEAGRRKQFRARLSLLLASRVPWSRFYHLDPAVYQTLSRDDKRLALMPEPVEVPPGLSHAEARSRLGVPTEGRYVGLAGLLDQRKGVDLLIRAFSKAALPATDRLLLVGKHYPPIRAMLDGEFAPLVRSGRIVSIDREVLTVHEIGVAIEAMDLVCLPYPRHIASVSMAVRASAAGRPILAANHGWLGKIVPRFDLGRTIDVNDTDKFAVSLAGAMQHASDFRASEAGRRFVKFHTDANFRAVWGRGVRDQLGIAQDPGLVEWDWVLRAVDKSGSAPAL